MTEGKDTSGGGSQGGSARSPGAVGKAAVGRAAVDGGDPPAPNGKAPAEDAAPERRPAPLPAVPANRSSSTPSAVSTSKPSAEPAKQTAPSMSGALRPSVVQAGSAAGSPPAARPPAPGGEVGLAKPTAHITNRQLAPSAPPEPVTQISPKAAGQAPRSTPQAPRTPTPLGKSQQPSAPAKGRATATASVPVPGSGAPVGATSVLGASASSGAGAGAAAGGGAASTARAQVGEAVRNVRATVAAAASRGPRRARLQLKKIDPWSVMKFSFAASIVLFIVFVVATALLYTVLDALGVWESLNKTIGQLIRPSDGTGAQNAKAAADAFVIDAKLVIGGAALLGAVNMVLVTALMTLAAFIYNVCADLVGGIEVTLAERD